MKAQDQDGDARVPVSCLDLAVLPEDERFAVWRDSISVLFDVTIPPGSRDRPFTSRITTCNLGSLLLGNTASQAQSFKRSGRLLSSDGLDHFLLQVYRQGQTAGQCGKTRMHARMGDILLLDIGQTLDTRADDFDNLTLAIPRALLARYLKSPEKLHGRVLPRESPLGSLLGEHLTALWQATPRATPQEANAMAEGVVGLAASYFGQITPSEDVAEIRIAMHLTIRQYIDRHFSDRNLTPAFLETRFHISKARLYRMFEPFGGVNRFIWDRRLSWCLSELLKPVNRDRRISEIAFAAGFNNEAHFCRLFRQAFGASASEIRRDALSGTAYTRETADLVDRRYEGWLRKLGTVSAD